MPFYNFNLLEQSVFIHEGGHCFSHIQFRNDGKPFKDSDKNAANAYNEAAIETLLSIGELVSFRYSNKISNSYSANTVAFDLYYGSIIPLFYFASSLREKNLTKVQKEFIFNELQEIYNLSSYINENTTEKTLNIIIRNITITNNITKDQVILLERVGEYLTRQNPHSYYNELIVRGLDNSAISHFHPLINFHKKYMSSSVDELKNICQAK